MSSASKCSVLKVWPFPQMFQFDWFLNCFVVSTFNLGFRRPSKLKRQSSLVLFLGQRTFKFINDNSQTNSMTSSFWRNFFFWIQIVNAARLTEWIPMFEVFENSLQCICSKMSKSLSTSTQPKIKWRHQQKQLMTNRETDYLLGSVTKNCQVLDL